jgi:3,4-dihydroxy 2-butanone 4-phosphate synthase/GTP cyclohydrolase II
MMNDEGKGAAVFISQENQSFNLINRLSLLREAQKEIEHKVPQIKPDDKDFGIGAQILHDLEISKIRVLSNATAVTKRIGMTGYGLEIVEYVNY